MFEKLLQKLMAWYYGSPLAKSMVQGMLTDLKEQGERILPIVESAIKTAALSETMSGKEKLASLLMLLQYKPQQSKGRLLQLL